MTTTNDVFDASRALIERKRGELGLSLLGPALQVAAARAGPLRPTVPQQAPGGLFAPPEPLQASLFGGA